MKYRYRNYELNSYRDDTGDRLAQHRRGEVLPNLQRRRVQSSQNALLLEFWEYIDWAKYTDTDDRKPEEAGKCVVKRRKSLLVECDSGSRKCLLRATAVFTVEAVKCCLQDCRQCLAGTGCTLRVEYLGPACRRTAVRHDTKIWWQDNDTIDLAFTEGVFSLSQRVDIFVDLERFALRELAGVVRRETRARLIDERNFKRHVTAVPATDAPENY